MKHAIATLQAEIENCRANEPIHQRAGDVDQANLCRTIATDCEAGVIVLQRILDRAVLNLVGITETED